MEIKKRILEQVYAYVPKRTERTQLYNNSHNIFNSKKVKPTQMSMDR